MGGHRLIAIWSLTEIGLLLYLVVEQASKYFTLNVSRNKLKLKSTEVFCVVTVHKNTSVLIALRDKHISFLVDKLHKPA